MRITRNSTKRNVFLSNDGNTNVETEPKKSLSIQDTDELHVYAASHIIKTEIFGNHSFDKSVFLTHSHTDTQILIVFDTSSVNSDYLFTLIFNWIGVGLKLIKSFLGCV